MSFLDLAGYNIPLNKTFWLSLTYIRGIGRSSALKIVKRFNLDPQIRANKVDERTLSEIGQYLRNQFVLGVDEKERQKENIIIKIKKGIYQGRRHILHLPVRGQKTKANAKTAKRLNYI
jgi:small subunit ribosomal protein S13